MSRITGFALIVSALLAVASASAQAPQQQPDMNAVLQAIQGLRSEIKTLRDDVTVLKRKSQASQMPANAAGESPKTSAEPRAKPALAAKGSVGKLQHGWIVWVYNMPDSWQMNFSAEPIGGFPYSKTRFDTTIHRNDITTSNNVAYKAEAFFTPAASGKYTFTISFNDNVACGAGLDIDGTPVIVPKVAYYGINGTLQGTKEITSTDAKITLYYGCQPGHPVTGIKLLVRGPQDLLPREVEANEIMHKVTNRE